MTTSSIQPSFDPEEIRAAERNLLTLLDDPDVDKRTMAYTEDATFVMSGIPPIQGRDEMVRRTKTRLFSCSLTPYSTEGNGRIACVYGLFTCFVGRNENSEGQPMALRFLIMWRKEPDDVWRIAREFLISDIAK